MIRKYKLPIRGTVLKREPLTGVREDPICVIPLVEIAGVPLYGDGSMGVQGCKYVCLNYNINEEWCEVELEATEEFHNWLTSILPQLRDIQKEKGWKLDKSKMIAEKAI